MKLGYLPLVFFLLIAQGSLFLVHFVVYEALVFSFDFGAFLLPLQIGLFILSCIFFFSTFLAHQYHNVLSRALYKLASIWLGFLFYFFLTSVLIGVIVVLSEIVSLNIPLQFIGKMLFGLSAALSLYGFTHAQKIRVTTISVRLPNIPDAWKNRRAVFFSDIHLGQVRGKKFMQRVVHAVNALTPDIVFIGGDLYDGVKVNESEVIKPLEQLISAFGTYFITGNHEYVSGAVAKFIEPIRELGITVLHDELIEIEGLQIVGVDYRDTTQRNEYRDTLASLGIDPTKATILLKHTPAHIDIAHAHGINFQLSGHTHKAQMFPGNLITRKVFKGFDYGHKKFQEMDVYTSSGVGTWGPPLRVGSPAEIVHIYFL